MLYCHLLNFFKNNFFWKTLSGKPEECQTIWIQIRPDILSGLIWIQTVCKVYQQRNMVGKLLTMFNLLALRQFCSQSCLTNYHLLNTVEATLSIVRYETVPVRHKPYNQQSGFKLPTLRRECLKKVSGDLSLSRVDLF